MSGEGKWVSHNFLSSINYNIIYFVTKESSAAGTGKSYLVWITSNIATAFSNDSGMKEEHYQPELPVCVTGDLNEVCPQSKKHPKSFKFSSTALYLSTNNGNIIWHGRYPGRLKLGWQTVCGCNTNKKQKEQHLVIGNSMQWMWARLSW